MKMMERDFNTDVTRTTDADGTARVRGFKGIYKITMGKGEDATDRGGEAGRGHAQRAVPLMDACK